jgi:hypothetical protein
MTYARIIRLLVSVIQILVVLLAWYTSRSILLMVAIGLVTYCLGASIEEALIKAGRGKR